MFFLAGLLVAGLAGLLVVPAFVRRALRLSAARARMLAPLSAKEAAAERDMLRAEHAVAQSRLERRIAALQDAVARRRAELGRQAATLVAAESAATDQRSEIEGLRADLAARQREILSLEGDLGASRIVLNDFGAQLDRASSEIRRLRDERLAIDTVIDEQRLAIAGLETRASGLEMKLQDAAQTARSKATAAEAERSRLSSELAARTLEVARAGGELAEAKEKGATLVVEVEKANAELHAARLRLLELEAAPTSRDRTAEESSSAENGRSSANGATQGQAVLADAVQRDRDSGPQSDRALREAISRLGADIARLSGPSGNGAAVIPKLGKSTRREPRGLPAQGADAPKNIASANVRQLQSRAPER